MFQIFQKLSHMMIRTLPTSEIPDLLFWNLITEHLDSSGCSAEVLVLKSALIGHVDIVPNKLSGSLCYLPNQLYACTPQAHLGLLIPLKRGRAWRVSPSSVASCTRSRPLPSMLVYSIFHGSSVFYHGYVVTTAWLADCFIVYFTVT